MGAATRCAIAAIHSALHTNLPFIVKTLRRRASIASIDVRSACHFCAAFTHVIFALNCWTRFALELCSRRFSLQPKSCLWRTLDKSFDACADKCVDDVAVTHEQQMRMALNGWKQQFRWSAASRRLARVRSGACLLRPMGDACSGRQIRNGLFLINLLAWALLIFAVSRFA